jgi:hypothetical protein
MTSLTKIIILLSLSAGLAVAQEPDAPPPPKPPFLAVLPKESAWQISYTQVEAAPATPSASPPTGSSPPVSPPPSMLSDMIIKNNGLRKEAIIWSNNTRTEKWIVDTSIFTQPKPGAPFSASSAIWAGITAIGENYPDFPDLVWVGLSNFKSVETKNGQKCFVYYWSESGQGIRPLDSPLPLEPTTVWVNIDTKLPVAVENQHEKAVYTYNLPLVSLTLPAECQEMVKQTKIVQKRLMGQQMVRPQ